MARASCSLRRVDVCCAGGYTGVRTGDHRPDGWVIARGPVRAARTIERQLEAADLAPTIAALGAPGQQSKIA